MAEPQAIWSTRKITTNKSISLTQNIILSYARDALQTMIRRIDLAHRSTILNQGDNAAIGVDLPSVLSDIVFQQGIASLLLFNDGQQQSRESDDAYKSRVERTAIVADRCKSFSVPNLKNRKIRNALTHLDEYLAEELAAPHTGWFIDVAVDRRDQFDPSKFNLNGAFIRSYIISEDKLLNFEQEVSLAELKEEAEKVLASVWPPTDVSYYSGPLYDATIAPKPYRLRLLEWWHSFPVPRFFSRQKNHIV